MRVGKVGVGKVGEGKVGVGKVGVVGKMSIGRGVCQYTKHATINF